jgi:hypothetical protein
MFAEKKRRHMSIDSPQMADNFFSPNEKSLNWIE